MNSFEVTLPERSSKLTLLAADSNLSLIFASTDFNGLSLSELQIDVPATKVLALRCYPKLRAKRAGCFNCDAGRFLY